MLIQKSIVMEEMTNHALSHLLLFKTHSNKYQTEWTNIIMVVAYNAVNLPMNLEFVPVVSTSSKLVLCTASDQQNNRVLYLIQPVIFSLFIRMECVSIAVKASMMDLVFMKSAVGALMATFAMEQYFMTAYIIVLMGIGRSTRKPKKGIFVPLALHCGTNCSKLKEKLLKNLLLMKMEKP